MTWFNDIYAQIGDGGVLLAGSVAVTGVAALVKRYRPERNISRGSAGWLNLWQAHRYGMFKRKNKRGIPGILLGDWNRWSLLPVYYHGDSNLLTVGPPGCMKGVGMFIPNTLEERFQCSYEPGGEATAVAIKNLREKGHNVHIFNPKDMFVDDPYKLNSGSINLIDRVDPKSDSFDSRALATASLLVGEPPSGEAANYFHTKSRNSYQALIMHCRLSERPENQNLVRVRQYIRGSKADWATLVMDMQNSPNDIVRAQGNEWEIMMGKSPKEFSGIVNTMETASKFLDDESVRRAVSTTTIRAEDLLGYDTDGNELKGAYLGIIIPLEFKTSHAALGRLVIDYVLATLISQQRLKRKAVGKVLLSVDEFPSLGKMSSLVDALSLVRKYDVRINLIMQSIAQAKDIYGEDGWKKIEGACDVRQFIAAWGLDTAEHVSQLCGEQTIIEGTGEKAHLISRKLITPDEVMRLPNRRQIVMLNNLNPMKLGIRPYWERPDMKDKFYDNPYHRKTPGLPLTWPAQAMIGGLTKRMGGFLWPVGAVAVAAAMMVGLFWL